MPENKDDIDLEGWDLHRAAWKNRFDIARALIASGNNVNEKGQEGDEPLHSAASYNSFETALLLIEHGAGVHSKMHLDWTPLHCAA